MGRGWREGLGFGAECGCEGFELGDFAAEGVAFVGLGGELGVLRFGSVRVIIRWGL